MLILAFRKSSNFVGIPNSLRLDDRSRNDRGGRGGCHCDGRATSEFNRRFRAVDWGDLIGCAALVLILIGSLFFPQVMQ